MRCVWEIAMRGSFPGAAGVGEPYKVCLRALRIDARAQWPHIWAMLILTILILAGVCFYAFIGTAPQEAVQLMLVLFWGFIIVAGFLAEFFY